MSQPLRSRWEREEEGKKKASQVSNALGASLVPHYGASDDEEHCESSVESKQEVLATSRSRKSLTESIKQKVAGGQSVSTTTSTPASKEQPRKPINREKKKYDRISDLERKNYDRISDIKNKNYDKISDLAVPIKLMKREFFDDFIGKLINFTGADVAASGAEIISAPVIQTNSSRNVKGEFSKHVAECKFSDEMASSAALSQASSGDVSGKHIARTSRSPPAAYKSAASRRESSSSDRKKQRKDKDERRRGRHDPHEKEDLREILVKKSGEHKPSSSHTRRYSGDKRTVMLEAVSTPSGGRRPRKEEDRRSSLDRRERSETVRRESSRRRRSSSRRKTTSTVKGGGDSEARRTEKHDSAGISSRGEERVQKKEERTERKDIIKDEKLSPARKRRSSADERKEAKQKPKIESEAKRMSKIKSSSREGSCHSERKDRSRKQEKRLINRDVKLENKETRQSPQLKNRSLSRCKEESRVKQEEVELKIKEGNRSSSRKGRRLKEFKDKNSEERHSREEKEGDLAGWARGSRAKSSSSSSDESSDGECKSQKASNRRKRSASSNSSESPKKKPLKSRRESSSSPEEQERAAKRARKDKKMKRSKRRRRSVEEGSSPDGKKKSDRTSSRSSRRRKSAKLSAAAGGESSDEADSKASLMMVESPPHKLSQNRKKQLTKAVNKFLAASKELNLSDAEIKDAVRGLLQKDQSFRRDYKKNRAKVEKDINKAISKSRKADQEKTAASHPETENVRGGGNSESSSSDEESGGERENNMIDSRGELSTSWPISVSENSGPEPVAALPSSHRMSGRSKESGNFQREVIVQPPQPPQKQAGRSETKWSSRKLSIPLAESMEDDIVEEIVLIERDNDDVAIVDLDDICLPGEERHIEWVKGEKKEGRVVKEILEHVTERRVVYTKKDDDEEEEEEETTARTVTERNEELSGESNEGFPQETRLIRSLMEEDLWQRRTDVIPVLEASQVRSPDISYVIEKLRRKVASGKRSSAASPTVPEGDRQQISENSPIRQQAASRPSSPGQAPTFPANGYPTILKDDQHHHQVQALVRHASPHRNNNQAATSLSSSVLASQYHSGIYPRQQGLEAGISSEKTDREAPAAVGNQPESRPQLDPTQSVRKQLCVKKAPEAVAVSGTKAEDENEGGSRSDSIFSRLGHPVAQLEHGTEQVPHDSAAAAAASQSLGRTLLSFRQSSLTKPERSWDHQSRLFQDKIIIETEQKSPARISALDENIEKRDQEKQEIRPTRQTRPRTQEEDEEEEKQHSRQIRPRTQEEEEEGERQESRQIRPRTLEEDEEGEKQESRQIRPRTQEEDEVVESQQSWQIRPRTQEEDGEEKREYSRLIRPRTQGEDEEEGSQQSRQIRPRTLEEDGKEIIQYSRLIRPRTQEEDEEEGSQQSRQIRPQTLEEDEDEERQKNRRIIPPAQEEEEERPLSRQIRPRFQEEEEEEEGNKEQVQPFPGPLFLRREHQRTYRTREKDEEEMEDQDCADGLLRSSLYLRQSNREVDRYRDHYREREVEQEEAGSGGRQNSNSASLEDDDFEYDESYKRLDDTSSLPSDNLYSQVSWSKQTGESEKYGRFGAIRDQDEHLEAGQTRTEHHDSRAMERFLPQLRGQNRCNTNYQTNSYLSIHQQRGQYDRNNDRDCQVREPNGLSENFDRRLDDHDRFFHPENQRYSRFGNRDGWRGALDPHLGDQDGPSDDYDSRFSNRDSLTGDRDVQLGDEDGPSADLYNRITGRRGSPLGNQGDRRNDRDDGDARGAVKDGEWRGWSSGRWHNRRRNWCRDEGSQMSATSTTAPQEPSFYSAEVDEAMEIENEEHGLHEGNLLNNFSNCSSSPARRPRSKKKKKKNNTNQQNRSLMRTKSPSRDRMKEPPEPRVPTPEPARVMTPADYEEETIQGTGWEYEKKDLRKLCSTVKDYKLISNAMHEANLITLRRNEFDVVVEKFGIPVSQHDLLTLTGTNWVNDHIIEFYLQMVVRRSNTDAHVNIGLPRVHAMNTYFYTKLINKGYSSVKNWTKNVDIFSKSLLFVPIHLDQHWALVVVDFRVPGAFYYDSMGDEEQTLHNRSCLTQVINYVKAEHAEKKGTDMDFRTFVREPLISTPQQENGSDCGIFLCKVAEFLSREAALTFDQADMPYFRQRMLWEIVHDELISP